MGKTCEEIKTVFSRRLRIAMVAKRMNSADLVRATDLGSGQVSLYLNAKSLPRADQLVTVAKGLGVRIDWLLGQSEKMR